MLIAFHKPYGVLSQFTDDKTSHKTLAEFGFPIRVYPIGRLDWDSEGLLLLSDEKKWNDLLLNPRNAHERTYHAQVEGVATEAAMAVLRKGVRIQDWTTLPCGADLLEDPGYAERSTPIRFRKAIPTSWVEIRLIEGKNRQVRRMTAAVGFPTLRLLRSAVGGFALGKLKPGKWVELGAEEKRTLLKAR
jgi:23S rRNA pseudouridine2457 synthase